MELELKYCVIPRIIVESGISDKKYTMFVTSKRIALILTGKNYGSLGLALGLFVGKGIGKLFGEDKPAIKDEDIDRLLSQDKSNIEIPTDRLIEIKLKKRIRG